MSRQGADSLPYELDHLGRAIGRKPARLYLLAVDVIGRIKPLTDFFDYLVTHSVITSRQRDILTLRAQGNAGHSIASKDGVTAAAVTLAERSGWGNILRWLTSQGKTLEDIGSLVGNDKPQKIERLSKIEEMVQELGGLKVLQARIVEEKKLGSEFITLLANVMGRLAQGGEYEDIVRDVQKMEFPPSSRERAEVLIRNAIDYFTLFPAPNSDPGSETG